MASTAADLRHLAVLSGCADIFHTALRACVCLSVCVCVCGVPHGAASGAAGAFSIRELHVNADRGVFADCASNGIMGAVASHA